MQPKNPEETLVWGALVGTYLFWLLGALYIVGSAIGWLLLGVWCSRWWRESSTTPAAERLRWPWVVWPWILGMITMEVALIIAHIHFDLGLGSLIKSSVGWAKGWALLAVFAMVGGLKVRPTLIYRAACIICLGSLIFYPLCVVGHTIHLPRILYVSPLQAVGGPGPEFFDVSLYEIDPDSGSLRYRLFAPWGPALGLMGDIYFFFAWQETNRFWRWVGVIGSLLMCWVSASRLAILAVPTVAVITWLLLNWQRPFVLISLGVSIFLGSVSAASVTQEVQLLEQDFTKVRPSSSLVRQYLGEIALYRWWHEAPVWGHGVVGNGPHLVEFMPIGSHQTWFGLLFIKGFVGAVSLAVPMFCSFLVMLTGAGKTQTGPVALTMLVILFLYTFAENLETLAYLYWPALLILSIAFHEQLPRTPPDPGYQEDRGGLS